MTATKIIIELEDFGQDFLRFELDARKRIVKTFPFQGWMWDGHRVMNKEIAPGVYLQLAKKNKPILTLKYPVKSVKEIAREAHGGADTD